MLFGQKLCFNLFSTEEEVSKCLQAKGLTIQKAISSINLASTFYQRQRADEAFDKFYDNAVDTAQHLAICQPQLP